MRSHSDRSLAASLRRSFQVLRRERADAFEAMAGALGRGELYLKVDDEAVLLRFGRGMPQVWPARKRDRRPPAVVCSRRAILDLADGRLTILEAVLRGDLEIVASAPDLQRLERGLGLYLRGAVRCGSFPRLLEEFRATVDSPSGRGDAHPDAG